MSEGACDTEDAENPALHHRNKLHVKIYKNKKIEKFFKFLLYF